MTVHFFARLKELAGADTMTIDVAEPATVAMVWRAATLVAPALVPYEHALSCAINATFSRMSRPVSDGDDVAFLPPVSGG
ncbi:MAG TPA: MoaD/ThiS family protein [Vicinamibacterales bacterium]|nr:MoaD/ThiS family protein [Vicinamibacterales bacterium]